jgi:hypothetical protein
MKGDITYFGNGLVTIDDGTGGYITTATSTDAITPITITTTTTATPIANTPITTNTTLYVGDVMDATEARAMKLEPVCTDEEWETFCNEVGLINE